MKKKNTIKNQVHWSFVKFKRPTLQGPSWSMKHFYTEMDVLLCHSWYNIPVKTSSSIVAPNFAGLIGPFVLGVDRSIAYDVGCLKVVFVDSFVFFQKIPIVGNCNISEPSGGVTSLLNGFRVLTDDNIYLCKQFSALLI